MTVRKEGRLIQLEKEDSNKQFIWFKILGNGNHIRIVACYFVSQVSKIYKGRGLDHKDPFASLKVFIATYSQLGEVLIVVISMLGLQVSKLAFFVVKMIVTLFGLQKKVIISGKEFQRTRAAISLMNNCLLYVGPLI